MANWINITEHHLCARAFVCVHFFFPWFDSSSGSRPPHPWGFEVTLTPYSVGLLWARDRHVSESCTWQQATLTRERHPCARRDSKPLSQQWERPQTHALDRAASGIGVRPCTNWKWRKFLWVTFRDVDIFVHNSDINSSFYRFQDY